ncbi:possible pfkB family carbohydrate kinase [Moesziomyces antarcticus T-34]|uniref:Adenosine kinase n=1 Tax=Pseudozyma antarctica (strain T-34) TaxID=1151754 RepID=M9MD32_PSEA3|nr:possible pfkB family carbohydrate kinase [Moesziomyces antarcticus T-34]
MAGGNFELVALGNPLLDMQIRNGEAMLEKYGLKPNDAVLADDKQLAIYQDIVDNYDVTYVAGGAAQNAARCAQYVLPPNSTAYLGCVGKDDLAKQLQAANDKEGLKSIYQFSDDAPTGSCAVVITGHNRSLCTNLGAAEKFAKSHLETAEAQQAIKNAKIFYLGGFFLTHGVESALVLANEAKARDASFTMNLSAPFIPQFFTAQVDQVVPFADVIFGNETEAEAWAQAHNLETKDLKQIAQAIADYDAATTKAEKRVVIITNGSQPTILAKRGESQQFVHETPKINPADIVDTNGAGDAFAGGVVGALVLGKSIDEAINVGHKLGGMCIGQVGPILKFPKENVL